MKKKKTFGGAKAKHESLVGVFEKYVVRTWVPRVPSFIETYHLTAATLLFSVLVIFFSYKARGNATWLLGIALMIIIQYFTDLLDGAVGRYRNTGLVKWGFVMDHFLDYIFVSSQVFGMFLYLPSHFSPYLILIQIFWSGVMINSFLYFGVTNQFRISYTKLGPTEFRIAAVGLFVLGYVFGLETFRYILPVVAVASGGVLCAVLYDSHRNIWALDMVAKAEQEKVLKKKRAEQRKKK